MSHMSATPFSQWGPAAYRCLRDLLGPDDQRPITLSSGALSECRGDPRKWINEFARAAYSYDFCLGELSTLHMDELRGLVQMAKAGEPFVEGWTLHLASKAIDEAELLQAAHECKGIFTGLVLHPDVLSDLAPWAALGSSLIVENMDGRKECARTAQELDAVFAQLPDARLCFDVAHAWRLDPTGQIAQQIITAHGPRICQIHISGIDPDFHHHALAQEQFNAYLPLIRQLQKVPLVLESDACMCA